MSRPLSQSVLSSLPREARPCETCVALVDRRSAAAGFDFAHLVAALQIYLDVHVSPAWGLSVRLMHAERPLAGAWALLVLDDARQVGAADWPGHTADGLPQAKVFLKAASDKGLPPSVAVSHQLVDMLVAPRIQRMLMGPDPKIVHDVAHADPVEPASFLLLGLPMSNFFLPAYYQPFPDLGARAGAAAPRYDHLGLARRPLPIILL